MNILIINAGSSSLKYQLIDMTDESILAKGIVERIGIPGGKLCHSFGDGKFTLDKDIRDHTQAMGVVLEALLDEDHGAISSISEIAAVGHRVLHGGEKFTASCLITQPVIDAIEEYIPLGPLHNPANLMGIRACRAVMPDTPMVAVFDTAFHQTMPKKAYLYGVPIEFYKKHHIRRYGFHGTSHRFVSARAVELLGFTGKESKIVVCHLGNGSSLSACVNGKCVDTSMGLTPLEGVLMGTRSGDVDPAIVEYIADSEHMTVGEVVNFLNKKSGLLGLSGVSSDMRDVWAAANAGNEMAKITIDIWAYRIRKYIGAYAAAMGGLDAIVFTAGIGENDCRARALILEGLEFLGVKLDPAANDSTRAAEGPISAPDSTVQVWVIPTNEEISIARDTLELIGK